MKIIKRIEDMSDIYLKILNKTLNLLNTHTQRMNTTTLKYDTYLHLPTVSRQLN